MSGLPLLASLGSSGPAWPGFDGRLARQRLST